MNRIKLVVICLLGCSCLFLASCTTNGSHKQSIVYDSEMMAKIDKAGKSAANSVKIIWVNPPEKKD